MCQRDLNEGCTGAQVRVRRSECPSSTVIVVPPQHTLDVAVTSSNLIGNPGPLEPKGLFLSRLSPVWCFCVLTEGGGVPGYAVSDSPSPVSPQPHSPWLETSFSKVEAKVSAVLAQGEY